MITIISSISDRPVSITSWCPRCSGAYLPSVSPRFKLATWPPSVLANIDLMPRSLLALEATHDPARVALRLPANTAILPDGAFKTAWIADHPAQRFGSHGLGPGAWEDSGEEVL